jgi:hypothetical protein
MGRYIRLWILLFLAFAGVFARFVNHDLLVYTDSDHIWIKDRATPREITVFSALAGLILASLTTWLHALGERVALAQPPGRTPPEQDREEDRRIRPEERLPPPASELPRSAVLFSGRPIGTLTTAPSLPRIF